MQLSTLATASLLLLSVAFFSDHVDASSRKNNKQQKPSSPSSEIKKSMKQPSKSQASLSADQPSPSKSASGKNKNSPSRRTLGDFLKDSRFDQIIESSSEQPEETKEGHAIPVDEFTVDSVQLFRILKDAGSLELPNLRFKRPNADDDEWASRLYSMFDKDPCHFALNPKAVDTKNSFSDSTFVLDNASLLMSPKLTREMLIELNNFYCILRLSYSTKNALKKAGRNGTQKVAQIDDLITTQTKTNLANTIWDNPAVYLGLLRRMHAVLKVYESTPSIREAFNRRVTGSSSGSSESPVTIEKHLVYCAVKFYLADLYFPNLLQSTAAQKGDKFMIEFDTSCYHPAFLELMSNKRLLARALLIMAGDFTKKDDVNTAYSPSYIYLGHYLCIVKKMRQDKRLGKPDTKDTKVKSSTSATSSLPSSGYMCEFEFMPQNSDDSKKTSKDTFYIPTVHYYPIKDFKAKLMVYQKASSTASLSFVPKSQEARKKSIRKREKAKKEPKVWVAKKEEMRNAKLEESKEEETKEIKVHVDAPMAVKKSSTPVSFDQRAPLVIIDDDKKNGKSKKNFSDNMNQLGGIEDDNMLIGDFLEEEDNNDNIEYLLKRSQREESSDTESPDFSKICGAIGCINQSSSCSFFFPPTEEVTKQTERLFMISSSVQSQSPEAMSNTLESDNIQEPECDQLEDNQVIPAEEEY